MKTGRIALVVLLALAVVVTAAVAAGGRRGMGAAATPGPGPGMGMGMGACQAKLVAALNLTDSQKADLKRIRDGFIAATKSTKDQIVAKVKQMRDLWAASTPDAAAIKRVAGEIDALRAEVRDKGVDAAIDAYGVLTDAQRQTVRDFMQTCPCPCGGVCCILGAPCPMGMGCGMGPGMGMGMGCGGAGCGYGMGNATGPRARMGTCPIMTK